MDLANRSSFITERDLNREFFEANRLDSTRFNVEDKSFKKKRGAKQLLLLPLGTYRAFVRNIKFCLQIVLPQIWKWIARKWKHFSLIAFLKNLFPGVTLLFTAIAAAFSCGHRRVGTTISTQNLVEIVDDHHIDLDDDEHAPQEDETPHADNRDIEVHSPHAESSLGFSAVYPNKELVRKSFFQDIFVGFSIGAMSIPQGMSYALLAGLEYQYGLYNNLVHPLLYFFFGTCRHAIVGVSAIENLMLGERLNSLLGHDATPSQRINAATALSLMSAAIFMLFRVCRLSVIADLLADPVLSGFATASAFVIGTSQLKYVFGMADIKSEWNVPQTIGYIISHFPESHGASLVCCFVSLMFLIACKQVSSRFCVRFPVPGPLLLVVIGCLVSWAVDIRNVYGIRIVGTIPRGLPGPYVPHVSWHSSAGTPDIPGVRSLFFQCLSLCPLYFIIHISIAKTIAMRQKYYLNNGQELVAFSAANLVGGLFQCYPTCTSLSRSSVAESLGSRTHFSGLAAALVVLCTLVFLTYPLGFLPMPSLAAVVLFGVSKMAEFGTLRKLWRLQKTSWEATGDIGGGLSSPDLLLWVIAFCCTIGLGASEGIIIAVLVSLVWVGRGIVRPEFIHLGRLQGTTIYRNRVRFPDAHIDPGIVIYRIDAPLNFCNAGFLERETRKALEHHFPTDHELTQALESNRQCLVQRNRFAELSKSQQAHQRAAAPRFFILDCASVNALDVTAISALARVAGFAASRQVMLVFANWKGPQRDFLFKADFYRIVPPHRCFLSDHDAVLWCKALQQSLRLTAIDPSPVGSTRIGSTDLQDSWELEQDKNIDHAILRPEHTILHSEDTLRAIEAREMAGTLMDGQNRPRVEAEWDCLSALAPNIRIVQEITRNGHREWMVTVNEESEESRKALH